MALKLNPILNENGVLGYQDINGIFIPTTERSLFNAIPLVDYVKTPVANTYTYTFTQNIQNCLCILYQGDSDNNNDNTMSVSTGTD